MEERCELCRFWIERHADIGGCRRYPPSFYGIEGDQAFPDVRKDMWCGEFKEKPNASEEDKEAES